MTSNTPQVREIPSLPMRVTEDFVVTGLIARSYVENSYV
jgi:hypothetical protein